MTSQSTPMTTLPPLPRVAIWLALVTLLCVAGCGGGGGDSSDTGATGDARWDEFNWDEADWA